MSEETKFPLPPLPKPDPSLYRGPLYSGYEVQDYARLANSVLIGQNEQLRAELTEARRQLAAQPAVPEAVAKDAARYRLLQRILFEDTNGRINAHCFPLADGSVFADRLSKTLDAILSATDSEVKK